MADALAVLAAFFFALAATLQQKGALATGRRLQGAGGFLELAKQRWWLLGTLILLCGYGAQAVALAGGQLALVQALLVTTIVFALPLGHWLTDQQVTRTEVLAAGLVAFGLGIFTVFGDEGPGRPTTPTWEWAATFAIFGALSAILVQIGRKADPAGKATNFGAAAGVLYALSAAMWKPTAEALGSGGLAGMLVSWEFYAWGLAAVVAFLIQQVSLATGQLAAAVAGVSVCNPIVSVIIGIVVLGENLADPTWHKVVAIAGLVVSLVAAIAITQSGQGTSQAGEQAQPDSQPGQLPR